MGFLARKSSDSGVGMVVHGAAVVRGDDFYDRCAAARGRFAGRWEY